MNILILLLFLGILCSSEFLHIHGVAVELTRKLVHSSAALLLCLFPWLYTLSVAMTIAVFFLIAFAVIESYGLLRSITSVARVSYGGIAFVAGVALSALYIRQSAWLPFQIAVIILGVCDPAAAFVGHRYQNGCEDPKKTIQGSAAFFFSSSVILLSAITYFSQSFTLEIIFSALLFSITLTLVEYFSPYGLDNLFLPILATMMLSIML